MSNIKTLFDALQHGIADLDGIAYCSAFPKRRDTVVTPAVFLDLQEMKPDQDSGTGELTLETHWEACLVLSDQEPPWTMWVLAQRILYWLFNHSWSDINVGRANLKNATPDQFSPELQGHVIWLLEWTHLLRTGENVWLGDEITPTEIVIRSSDTDRTHAVQERLEIDHESRL